jgi:hypothetical protein
MVNAFVRCCDAEEGKTPRLALRSSRRTRIERSSTPRTAQGTPNSSREILQIGSPLCHTLDKRGRDVHTLVTTRTKSCREGVRSIVDIVRREFLEGPAINETADEALDVMQSDVVIIKPKLLTHKTHRIGIKRDGVLS